MVSSATEVMLTSVEIAAAENIGVGRMAQTSNLENGEA